MIFSGKYRPMRQLFLAILLVLMGWGEGQGRTVAVLPFDDLSAGGNALNLSFAAEVREVLREQGLEIVSPEKVNSFLAENRLRATGYIDSLHAVKLGMETGCDLIVVGSVTEKGCEKEGAVGFTYTILDGVTGKPVFGGSGAMSLGGCIGVLGLREPNGIDDIRATLLRENLLVNKSLTATRTSQPTELVRINGVALSKDVVQAGQPIECRMVVDFLQKSATRVFARIDDEVIPFAAEGDTGFYRALWPAPPEEGDYDLSFEMVWDETGETLSLGRLARFQVINTPPPLKIDLKNVRTFNQISAVKDQVLIVPSLEDSRLLSHWSMAILNADGEEVARTGQDGNLPPRLIWKGKDKSNHSLSDGVYQIAFDAWDYAGNRSRVQRTILRQSQELSVNLTAIVDNNLPYMHLAPAAAQVVPVESWSLRVMTSEGDTLLHQKGDALPVKLPLRDPGKISHVLCDLEVVDILGNRVTLHNQRVTLEKPKEPATRDKKFSSWAWVEGSP